jgi:hypothetical protein
MKIFDLFSGWGEAALGRLLGYAAEPRFVAALGVFLLACGIASRRWINFVGAVVLIGIGSFAAIAPASLPDIIAVGAILGSLLSSYAGYISRRRELSQSSRIDKLEEEIQQLQLALQRRFLRSLNALPQEDSIEADPASEKPMDRSV